ncbi:MAG: SH3 domain-containing protein [Cyanobacteriota bacterium]
MKASVHFWLLGLLASGATAGFTFAAASSSTPKPISQNAAQSVVAQTLNNNIPAASQSNLSNFPHWRISLVNQVEQSADFDQFQQRLWTAVHNREASFIRNIVTPQTTLGSPDNGKPLSAFNINNPEAPFWRQMEKAIAKGCVIEPNSPIPNRDRGSNVWQCPGVLRAYEAAQRSKPATGQYGNYNHVVIVGDNVNVRSQPGTGAPVIGVVSNEIIQMDRATFEKLPQRMQQAFANWNPEGWTPVILPNGKRGYVQNRFAYEPLGYRAVFVKSGGKWQLRAFVTGD